ncbi:MAG: hypothetical protein ACI4IR_03815 [Eubacterium sp.]
MTSTALKSKGNFAPAFKKVFRQRAVNSIVLLVVTVFISIVGTIITFNNYIPYYTPEKLEILDITEDASMMMLAMAAVCGLFSLITAPEMFKEIYKKRSCDHYFATPIKREEHFCANFLYGVLANIVAFVLSAVVFILPLIMYQSKKCKFIVEPIFFAKFIAILLAVLAIYSAFVMCAVASGKRFHYMLLSFICLFSTPVAFEGIVAVANRIWGFYVSSAVASAISPAENAFCSLYAENLLLFCVISLLEIAGMFAAGLILFKRRKAEVAEVAVSGRVVPFIILAVMTTAAYMYIGAGRNAVIGIICGCVFAVLTAMIFTAILYKAPFTKKTGITTACVCLVCSLIMGVISFPSYSSYVKNVPNAEEVESITLTDLYSDTALYDSTIWVGNSEYYEYENGGKVEIKTPEAIEKAVEFHKSLVSDDTIKASQQYLSLNPFNLFDYIFGTDYDSYYGDYSCRIDYKLKSGKTLSRTYTAVNTKYLKESFVELMKTEEMFSQIRPFNYSEDDLLYIDISGSYDGLSYESSDGFTFKAEGEDEYFNYITRELDKKYYPQMIEAYKKDVLNSESKERFCDMLNTTAGTGFYVDFYAFDKYAFDNYLEISVYSISNSATKEQAERIKNMKPDEIKKLCNWDYVESDPQWDLMDAIIGYTICVYKTDTNTVDYLRSIGVAIEK